MLPRRSQMRHKRDLRKPRYRGCRRSGPPFPRCWSPWRSVMSGVPTPRRLHRRRCRCRGRRCRGCCFPGRETEPRGRNPDAVAVVPGDDVGVGGIGPPDDHLEGILDGDADAVPRSPSRRYRCGCHGGSPPSDPSTRMPAPSKLTIWRPMTVPNPSGFGNHETVGAARGGPVEDDAGRAADELGARVDRDRLIGDREGRRERDRVGPEPAMSNSIASGPGARSRRGSPVAAIRRPRRWCRDVKVAARVGVGGSVKTPVRATMAAMNATIARETDR